MPCLCLIAFHELKACRGIEKEVPHHCPSPLGHAAGLDFLDFPPLGVDLSALDVSSFPGGQGETRNRGERWKRFTAKTES